jgi:UDP-N-acetyl-D-galactosamine dehydrogenase
LKEYGTKVTIYDPLANPEEVKHEYGLTTVKQLPGEKYDAVVLTVAHKEFLEMNLDQLKNGNTVVYDVKGVLGDRCDKKL